MTRIQNRPTGFRRDWAKPRRRFTRQSCWGSCIASVRSRAKESSKANVRLLDIMDIISSSYHRFVSGEMSCGSFSTRSDLGTCLGPAELKSLLNLPRSFETMFAARDFAWAHLKNGVETSTSALGVIADGLKSD